MIWCLTTLISASLIVFVITFVTLPSKNPSYTQQQSSLQYLVVFYNITGSLHHNNEKSAWRRRKHCALAIVRRNQQFRPAADPLHGGTERPKFNQLEMVTFLYLQTQFGEDRCTQFWVIMVTDPQINTQTDRGNYNTLCCSFASTQCNY